MKAGALAMNRSASPALAPLAALACLALAACGAAPPLPPPPPGPLPAPPPPPIVLPEPVRVTPDAPFREHMPSPGPVVPFAAPKIESFSLNSGLRVLFVERHDLPIVSVAVVVRAGAGDVPERPGVVAMVGALLEQGTKKRTALEVSDAYEAIGAEHSAWASWDSCGAEVKVTSDHLAAALELLAGVVTQPAFPEPELDRVRARRLSQLAQEKNDPRRMAFNAAAATVFGRAHPYGNPLVGSAADLQRMTRAEVLRAYERLFWPNRATIVVAGDVSRDAIAVRLGAAFGAWRGQGRPEAPAPPRPPPPPLKDAPRVVFVDATGASQSEVKLVDVGVPRSAPDRDAVVVMNTILGGMFSSRINLNLREAHAYTYGAYSAFAMQHGAGAFTAGGSIVADKTPAAIHELFSEVVAMRDRPVSDAELSDAKESLALSLPSDFETVGAITGALTQIAVYDLPLDEYATLPARIERVTVEDVQKAARQHLHPEKLRVVVVGDKALTGPQIEQLHLGAPLELNPYGDPLR